jgi:hypothetical protein
MPGIGTERGIDAEDEAAGLLRHGRGIAVA